MCTIMTINREFYKRNRAAVLARIIEDGYSNPHGVAVLMYSQTAGFIKIEAEMFDDGLLDICWDRIWLHFRYATTDTIGIDGCHNFASGNGWYIQHNGMIACGDSLPVDSMAIAKLVRLMGPHLALKALENMAEKYANTFIVGEYGDYFVGRLSGGSLYTDNKGNYSSHPVASIKYAVEHNTISRHRVVK